jgi:Caspase domain
MMRWAQDDLGVAQELNTLATIFQDQYGFNVEEWKIPADKKSHTGLMQKALDFLDDYDSEDNLFILYYAGHGFINQDRQSTWAWRVFGKFRIWVAWLTAIAHRMRVAQQLIGHTFKDYSRERSLMSLFFWIVVLLQVRHLEAETPSWKLLQPVALKAEPRHLESTRSQRP